MRTSDSLCTKLGHFSLFRNLSRERGRLGNASLGQELASQEVLQLELVLVSKVRNIDRGAAGADPVGADWTRVPSSKASHHILLVTS